VHKQVVSFCLFRALYFLPYSTLFDVKIWFGNNLLRIFVSMFIRDIGVKYSFLVLFLPGFTIRVILIHTMNLEVFLPFLFYGIVYGTVSISLLNF
jgi:hypothetical protein